MTHITPEMVAEIASKLYNQVPQSEGLVPVVASHDTATPLSDTSNTLVHQQTLQSVPNSYSDLKGFVSFVQQSKPTSLSQQFGLPFDLSIPGMGAQAAVRPTAAILSSSSIASIRNDFPILKQTVNGKQLVWFDNAATTQKPLAVIEALTQFYSEFNSNIHRGAHTLAAKATDAYEGARGKVQRYLNAESVKEIVFVRGTTEGINLVAQALGSTYFKEGDEIILTELEHHANIVPWQMLAQKTGAKIRVVPIDSTGELILSEYQRLLNSKTKLVAFPHANNSLGTVLPIHELTRFAKQAGALVLIDGAQSVAHLPVDVQAIGCDFFVFSGHKIFGPTGIGALYAREEWLWKMDPWQGGGSMIKDVTFERTVYEAPPAKFEAGTPNVADAYGLGVALDYVSKLGLSAIAQYEHHLLEYATQRLQEIDRLTLIGTAREKVAVTSFVIKDKSAQEVGKYLDEHGIAVRSGHHCAQPSLRKLGLEATVRPSYSLYNTCDEIDRMVDALKRMS